MGFDKVLSCGGNNIVTEVIKRNTLIFIGTPQAYLAFVFLETFPQNNY